jgi:ketopantoate reductase
LVLHGDPEIFHAVFQITVERTWVAARWDKAVINDLMEKGRAVCGDIMRKVADAVHRVEAREAEEARVRLMETNRDELINLADKVEGRAADEMEPSLLIELGEEIEYRRDNVASIARLLKGNIHEELKERA